jgi:hypothetical protein
LSRPQVTCPRGMHRTTKGSAEGGREPPGRVSRCVCGRSPVSWHLALMRCGFSAVSLSRCVAALSRRGSASGQPIRLIEELAACPASRLNIRCGFGCAGGRSGAAVSSPLRNSTRPRPGSGPSPSRSPGRCPRHSLSCGYGRARASLDRHATYIVVAFIAGAARETSGPANPPPGRPRAGQAEGRDIQATAVLPTVGVGVPPSGPAAPWMTGASP